MYDVIAFSPTEAFASRVPYNSRARFRGQSNSKVGQAGTRESVEVAKSCTQGQFRIGVGTPMHFLSIP